jgi:hypothetical protein
MKSRILLFVFFFTLLSDLPLFPQAGTVRQLKLTKFRLQSSYLIPQSGEELTSGNYKPDVWWFPVNVPSTVLTGLVANKVYPDPYIGLNNMLIPDASDEFNKKYDLEKYSQLPGQSNPWKNPYWYITYFDVPTEDSGRHFDLIFKGINYRAAVWLNGKQVADSSQMAGMFAEYRLDVSGLIKTGAPNHLAVKIYPLDYPGLPAEEQLKTFGDFYANGGPTGDIGKNVTMLCSVGWDWIPPVRDRNIGIWQPVYLRTSGHVNIIQPQIITTLPSLPDTGTAKLTVRFRLKNNGNNEEKGKVFITVTPATFGGRPVQFTKNITVRKNSSVLVDFNPGNTSELIFNRPRLWWPNGYGKPDLYRIRIEYHGASGLLDEQTFLFGIRSVESKAVDVNGTWRRDFYVNGRRIQLTGGAWVPDMMLNRDSLRYDHEFRLCRNANINLVRIWGGGVTPSDHFFEAADRYGLLVWSDFWITGDTQGEFKGSPDWPVEGDVFKKNVASTIYRIRNHPSLLVWTGGNEGHARKELYYAMRDSIIKLDGTRPFIPSSSGFARLPEGWDAAWPDGKPAGVYSGGPYAWQDPKVYFQKADEGRDWVFKDETGIPSQPPFSSLSKNIVNLVWDKSLPFPFNNSWGYHDACTGNGHYENYYAEMVKRYGEPVSMKEFSDKMQLMNASGYQGIFEAAGHRLNEIGGVMLWKLNAAFPSVVWQVYDWYLVPNAGYYFMQNACEPIHIQLNTKDLNVEFINRTYNPLKALTARIEIFDLNSKLVFSKTDNFDLGASESREGLQLAEVIKKTGGVSFVVLNLVNSTGKILSHNVYWLSANNDFRSLKELKHAEIKTNVLEFKKSVDEERWTFQFTNTGKTIAFFINPQILSSDEEVLSTFWSANYFTLAPGEKIVVKAGFVPNSLKGRLVLKLEGWNAGEKHIQLRLE